MRVFYKIATVLSAVTLMVSCQNKSERNYQFFPNMYQAVGYETYDETDAFRNGKEGQLPVEGTVSRGWMPYDYNNTLEDYQQAKLDLKSPLDSLNRETNLEKGRELYNIYCAVCHGAQGNGKGILVEREKILGVPSYDDAGRAITEGSVYHVIYYGLNSMGSYASQLSATERWQVTEYVMQLKSDLEN
ncbi:c-type cytochrome [Robertkochia aurantiaca]|uniref:c-type cytochrome n=1 Tax=Robertkochia aurantiaca TaxID=2873700 RepID=UPI001CCFBFD8|nr:cytochrome c [Robertkochia sp. 3YJGBD-33]